MPEAETFFRLVEFQQRLWGNCATLVEPKNKLVEQGRKRYNFEHCFRTASSDWSSIEATMLSNPVQRTHASDFVFEFLAL
jgi:hypothetical protein